jgi:hypothetical protein
VERDSWRRKRNEHMATVRDERKSYHIHKTLAAQKNAEGDNTHVSIILDGMDQAKTTLPPTRRKGGVVVGQKNTVPPPPPPRSR